MRYFLNIMFTLTEEQEESAYNLYISEVRNLRLGWRAVRTVSSDRSAPRWRETTCMRVCSGSRSRRWGCERVGRGQHTWGLGDLHRWPCDRSRALCRGHLVSSDCTHGWWQMGICGSALPLTRWTWSTASSPFTGRLQGLSVGHLVTTSPELGVSARGLCSEGKTDGKSGLPRLRFFGKEKIKIRKCFAARDGHTRWSKSERERQTPYDIAYVWNPK